MELPSTFLLPRSKKNEKTSPRKNFLYFREWNFLAPKWKEYIWKENPTFKRFLTLL